ncbi:transcription initiation factor TFIID subunit 4b-like [Zingiber officinale]|uniref:transcription initiation factor TFIID subunit 4b-like n=1 Tax=Zingiber officinale TaxID=94328 RepID=UPI001C4ABE3E|nr:transcription initiation factor TFIID subunit 4b-like [Zingiber officinale]XP_042375508.1 transcription initiation factor TFIID subunit 4b-like [Zingiber officinale]XP_042375509.1 transcription initiation factor TFIID subunit 4b-like [Zingiber officinale]
MQASSSASEQVIRQWKTPSEVGNDQIVQKEQNQPLQSLEQHSSGGELVRTSSIQPRVEQLNHVSKQDQMTFQQEIMHSNNCQQQSEANSVKPVDKGPEQSNIPVLDTIADPKLDVAQHSEKQQQQQRPHIVQQSNSQQAPDIANAAARPSESQQLIMQQSNSQQTPTSSQSNMALRTKTASSIPFHMLIPILRPHLDKDRSMQLQSIFNKLRNKEVSKEDFLRVVRNTVGDQMLRQAARKVQMQQLQAQASQNTPSNTNLFSLPAQASSQQVSRGGTQQISGAQSFPALHSLPSQNVIVPASSPGQPHVPALHPSTGPREVGIGSNGKGPHLVQNYSNSMNMSSSERDGLMGSTQSINGQQKLQSSISVSGSTNSYITQTYPRPSMSSSTSLRPNLESHPRPVSRTQGLVSTLIRPTQPINTMRMPYQQGSNNETKRQQTGSLTNHSSSLRNLIALQMSAESSGLQSTSYVNQEVVDQSSEPPKVQFSSSETTSFDTSHLNQGNSAFGSSMVRTNQVSGSVPSQADQNTQMDGNTKVDVEKDKEDGRSKAVKANKNEDDKLRITAANVAARAAVGGDDMLSKWQLMAERSRQKREGFDGASASQLGKSASSKSSLNLGIGSREIHESEKKNSSMPTSGVLMQASSSASKRVIRQWKTPSEVGDDQIVQKEQNQPLQSLEQHSSGGELVRTSSIQPRVEQLNHVSKQDQMTFQQEIMHSNNCQQQSEANSVKPEDKGPEQSNIPVLDTIADPKLDVAQHSEKQQQQRRPHIVQQSNSQQTPDIANAAARPSESQQLIMQQSNSQQTPTSSQSNMALRTKTASSIPFHMLIPILRPHLDKHRSMQLQSIFNKLRNKEVSKEDFLRVIRNTVGDQMLRQAAGKVQMQQLQAQASQNAPSNTNLFSLPAQASSQQVSRGATQQISGAQSFPALHSLPSQNVIVPASSPGQPHVPALHPSTGPREVGIGSNGKGPYRVQYYSNSMNMSSSERDGLMGSTQSINRPQKLQSSISVSGSTNSYNTQAYPRPSMSSSTSLRPNLESHPRPVSHTQGLVSTLIRPTQPINTMRMPAYQQGSNNDTKRQQTGSLTDHSSSLRNLIALQMSAESSGLQSTSYVNQEVVDQSSEPPKVQFSSSETTSFDTLHLNQANSAFGSNMVTTNRVSGSVPRQADQNTQQVTSATLPPPGSMTKSPLKKPSAGQKKPFDALGSSPPMFSKKQKTAGTSLDQSIVQLNDVAVVSGVNLREEEEQLLSGLKEDSRESEAT